MAFPIAAILKKAAIAVGSNKKVLKTVGCIALGLVVIICMPIAAVLGIFSGGGRGIDRGGQCRVRHKYFARRVHRHHGGN